jgi:hypothetical protein
MTQMNNRKVFAALILAALVTACSSVEVEVWDSGDFGPANFQTYSWRSEPFANNVYSRDPIYVIDPVLRQIVDAQLAAKGFRKVPRDGDFTVDYTYAPGLRMGVASDAADNLSPRAGVRPNASVSQAERDNAIALSGVKETRNISLQFNDGQSGRELWGTLITKFTADANAPDKERVRSALESGVRRSFKELPAAT